MGKSQVNHRIAPFPRIRQVYVDTLHLGHRKHTVHALLEADVTDARGEMAHLADEFLVLAGTTQVPTPAIDRLYPYFDPEVPPMPEGRAQIPLRWGSTLAGLGLLLALLLGIVALFRRLAGSGYRPTSQ